MSDNAWHVSVAYDGDQSTVYVNGLRVLMASGPRDITLNIGNPFTEEQE